MCRILEPTSSIPGSCAIRERVSPMRVAGIALFLLAVVGRDLHGQTLTVSVRDTGGQAIQQASLTLVDSAGRVVATTRTAPGGLAQLDQVAPGAYRVMARRFGFLPRYSEFVRIGRADTVSVRITLNRMNLVIDEIAVASLEPRRENRRHFARTEPNHRSTESAASVPA